MPAQKVAISGSSGLIGSAVARDLQHRGLIVQRFIRPQTHLLEQGEVIPWNPEKWVLDSYLLKETDVICHFAGVNIAAKRWTPVQKQLIYDSRIHSTRLLAEKIGLLKKPPRLVISASAIGYYGSHDPQETITEEDPKGKGFLSDVCGDWEAALQPLSERGVRVVFLRLGMVLARRGGALAKLLPPFLCGLGGPLGNGRQMMSWITLDEIPLIVWHLMHHEDIRGPVNVVTPHAVSNQEFTKILSRLLRRPAILPLPTLGVKLLFGEMGEALLLGGAKVLPKRLRESGYIFQFPDLKSAFQHLLQDFSQR
jgi:uncharacterized protein (TIGR01777 family)